MFELKAVALSELVAPRAICRKVTAAVVLPRTRPDSIVRADPIVAFVACAGPDEVDNVLPFPLSLIGLPSHTPDTPLQAMDFSIAPVQWRSILTEPSSPLAAAALLTMYRRNTLAWETYEVSLLPQR